MKHITWQAGDIITDEKWNNIQNNYQLKFKHFNIPTTTVKINNQTCLALNITDTILENKLNQGYICYFIKEDHDSNKLFYLKRITKSFNTTYYEFRTFSGDLSEFTFDKVLNKLVKMMLMDGPGEGEASK